MKIAQDLLSESYATVDGDASVSTLLGKLSDEKEVFVKERDSIGIFQPHHLTKSKVDITTMKAKNVARNIPKLEPNTELLRIADLMFTSNTPALPMLDNGDVQGIVHVYNVFRYLDQLQGDSLTVVDARSPKATTIKADNTIQDAMATMRKNGIDRLPVTEDGEITGFLSARDIVMEFSSHHQEQDKGHKPNISTRAFQSERHAPQIPVSDFMTNEVIRIDEDATLTEAGQKMRENNIYSLLVGDHILTKRDVLEAVSQSVQKIEGTIHYKGWNELSISDFALQRGKEVVERSASKLQTYLHNEFELTVHVKQYQTEGSQTKYSMHTRVSYPGGTIASDKQHDWEFMSALHQSLQALEDQAKKKFENSQKGRPTPRKNES